MSRDVRQNGQVSVPENLAAVSEYPAYCQTAIVEVSYITKRIASYPAALRRIAGALNFAASCGRCLVISITPRSSCGYLNPVSNREASCSLRERCEIGEAIMRMMRIVPLENRGLNEPGA